jgi:hypothetical protein
MVRPRLEACNIGMMRKAGLSRIFQQEPALTLQTHKMERYQSLSQ